MRNLCLRILARIVVVLAMRTAAAAEVTTVDQVLEYLNLPPDAAARIRRGEMVQSDPKESSDREMAMGLTFLIQQPLPEVFTAFRATVDLKADPHLSASVPIRGPGTPADFASLTLGPDGEDEAQRYLEARAGDTLNLSAEEIRAFNALEKPRATRRSRSKNKSGVCCSPVTRPTWPMGWPACALRSP